MIFNQCCVCRLPAAPASVPRDRVSHGYHKSCYVEYYTNVCPDEEMLADVDEIEGWLPEVEDAA